MRMGFRMAAVAAAICGAAGAARADTFKAPSEAFPTIQSAIDEAGPGDTIIVLRGVHDETLSVEGKNDLTIKGKGSPTLTGVNWVGGTGGAIQGLTFVAGPCRFEGTTDMDVSKVKIFTLEGHAIESIDNTGFRIAKVHISGAGGDGIHDEGSTDLVIEKCLIEDCGGDGIDLSSDNLPADCSDGAFVSKNRVINCEFGVNAGGDNITVEKNRIEESGITGIHFGPVCESFGALIEKNRVGNDEAPLTEAIQIFGQSFNVWSNTVENGGIREDGQYNRLEKNKVTGADTGIRCDGEFPVLYRNTVRGCDTGIEVRSPFATLDYNRVSFPNIFGIRVTGDGTVSTYRNRVSGAAGRGIMVETSGNFFFKDTCRGSGTQDYTDVFPIGTNSLEGCSFGTTGFEFNF